MKYALILMIIFFVFTTNVFSQECDEMTRARMIKSGILDKTIEVQCGKIVEKKKVSENNAKQETVVKVVDDDEETKTFQKRKFQVQVILVSALGSGVSFNYYLKNNISVGVDSQNISDSWYASTNTLKYEYKRNLTTIYYYGRYYPSNDITSFFTQGGLVTRSWKMSKQGYKASNKGKTVNRTTKYPNVALNLGLGWNWIHEDSGFSGGIYFVNIIGGDPEHTYVSETGWYCPDSCKQSWEDYTKENMRTFAGMINMGYNF